MRARAPIVPVAVVGAEEAMPVFGHLRPLKKLTGLIYFPVTPTFPWLGLPAAPRTCRRSSTSASWSRSRPTSGASEPWDDKGLVQTVAEEVRARIQEELYEMLADRKSVWLG